MKKAKRKTASAQANLSGMDVQSLLELRKAVEAKLDEHKRLLEKQIEQIAPQSRHGNKTPGRKVEPKYRSKKDPKLTWAGRGALPLWMRDEMKAGRLKKDSFLIK
jgi:DNA-binding protein H-NS